MDGVRFERNDTVRQKFSQGVVYFSWRFEMRGTEGLRVFDVRCNG